MDRKLPSRFLILSNELPRFGDASGAIARRFIVLVMKRSFLGEENTH
jgi:putative DNA primase/helicase